MFARIYVRLLSTVDCTKRIIAIYNNDYLLYEQMMTYIIRYIYN